MANSPSTIGVDDAATPDKYLWTYSYTVGGTASQEQVFLPGPNPFPTYTVTTVNCTLATANSHLLFVQADGTNYNRLKAIQIYPQNLPASASSTIISLVRVSTVGSGGTATSFSAHDTSDSYGGTAQVLPSSKGTEGAFLKRWAWHIPSTAYGFQPYEIHWEARPGDAKELIFGNGTATGLAIHNSTAIAACMVTINLVFSTTSFL